MLAEEAIDIGGGTDEARLAVLTGRLLARSFDNEERRIAMASLQQLRAWYADRPDEAKQLNEVGSATPKAIDPVELAAWTMLANELMNLDEFLCK